MLVDGRNWPGPVSKFLLGESALNSREVRCRSDAVLQTHSLDALPDDRLDTLRCQLFDHIRKNPPFILVYPVISQGKPE